MNTARDKELTLVQRQAKERNDAEEMRLARLPRVKLPPEAKVVFEPKKQSGIVKIGQWHYRVDPGGTVRRLTVKDKKKRFRKPQ